MNSLMQCYYNQAATPIYAAAAAAAASRNVDVCSATDVNDAATVLSTAPSSSLFSRRHQQIGPTNHRSSRLPPDAASQPTCLYSFLGVPNRSECRHANQLSGAFADAMLQSAPAERYTSSTKLSPPVAYDKSEHQAHTDMESRVYSDCRQQLYDDSSLVVGLNGGHYSTYKVEKPSPPTTPNAESQQKDATEMWKSRAHYSKQDITTVQTEKGKSGDQTSQNDDDLAPLHGQHDDIDDTASGSASTRTSTTMTTPSAQHQQQQQQQQTQSSDSSSCDAKQTQLGFVCPIYPWMTRVHSTHGMSNTNI